MEKYNFDWSDLAFGSKKPLKSLKATFIAAPRELSSKRFTQLIKEFLSKSPIVLGIAKEKFIDGFDGQAQFATLKRSDIQHLIDKVNSSSSPNKIYTLDYFQRELDFILQKVPFREVILVNGSWKQTFHTTPAYYTLSSQKTDYRLVSPFADEAEALDYAKTHTPTIDLPKPGTKLTEKQIFDVTDQASKASFDYSYQIGAALARKVDDEKYEFITSSFNRVIPYQTYAMHYGNSREKHFSSPHDTNHYDAIHAEMDILIKASSEGISLDQTSLFIDLLPCPNCARTLSQTGISEVVYRLDHSDGYAVKLFEQCGKVVRRLV